MRWLLPLLLLLIAAAPAPVSERERFDAEQTARQAQIALDTRKADLAERAQVTAEQDLAQRRTEAAGSRWTSPLVLAVLVAAIAAAGNAVVAYVNGAQQRALETTRAGATEKLESGKADAQIALEREKARAQRALDEQESESARILEVIKTGDPEIAARNMQFLVDAGLVAKPALVKKLTQYLETRRVGEGPALPTSDGKFKFTDSPELTPASQAALATSLDAFLVYLDGIGFPRDDGPIAIVVKPNFDNAHYLPDTRTMEIGTKLRDDPDVARHEYMHHALVAVGAAWREDPAYLSIESALADYYPCSFAGSPVVAAIAGANLGLDPPWLRRLTSPLGYADITDSTEHHAAGEIWGSLFWELRGRLGDRTADVLLRKAWSATKWPKGRDRASRVFVAALRAAALATEDDHAGVPDIALVEAVLQRRGFPMTQNAQRRRGDKT
jgi:hypothetical protein